MVGCFLSQPFLGQRNYFNLRKEGPFQIYSLRQGRPLGLETPFFPKEDHSFPFGGFLETAVLFPPN